MSLSEIITKLDKAGGPSLELDGMIWCAVNGYEFVMWDGAGCVYRNPSEPKWQNGITHAPASMVRPYSASIDAAVALVQRELPGCEYETTNLYDVNRVTLHSGDDHGPWYGTHASSMPIALCIAALKALQSLGGSND